MMAIASPLLEVSIDGAKGVLFNVTGGEDLGILEVYEAADIIAKAADPDAQIIFGAMIDPNPGRQVKITLIATGFDSTARNATRARAFPGVTPQGQPAYNQRPQQPQPRPQQQPSFSTLPDDLDIPPFLRNRRK